MNTTIILTATVNVNVNKSCIFQTSNGERIQTYLKSILSWLKNTNFNIVLVDNSGYNFNELQYELYTYSNRFEIIYYTENTLSQAKYLINNVDKGASELFAINYAFYNSKIISSSQQNFIIKITGRYFISELENYLNKYDLTKYDCLTQNNLDRCEMVGCNINKFNLIFNVNSTNNNGIYDGHVENVYKNRSLLCSNVLRCELFNIEPTQRGGINEIYLDI
jgi:hypothetical protein